MSSANYTVTVNGTKYSLSDDFRRLIERRAEHAYEENWQFSCWWKVANPSDYSDEEWDENVHEAGDPILVIETQGPVVPWDKLDQFKPEAESLEQYEDMNAGSTNSDDNDDDNVKTISLGGGMGGGESADEIPRTHFSDSPQSFEGVPDPDGEEKDRVPQKPERLDEPSLVAWVPENTEIDHVWSTGEAIAPVHSWVEWNVQQKALQPKPDGSGDCQDRFESLLESQDCPVEGEVDTSDDSDESTQPADNEDMGGKYGGNNWQV